MIWNYLKNKKPLATESGCWDGLKSDKILVCTISGKYHVVEMYEGFMDGSAFCNFYDERDFYIDNIVCWTDIDAPF